MNYSPKGENVSDKILVIIGTAESEKAQAGAMYAVNALKYSWMTDVKLFLFGPAEKLLLEDPDFEDLIRQFMAEDRTPVACKFLADRDGQSKALTDLGVDVAYVGSLISEAIRDGYVPMVW
jgi:hypothetical protein